MDDAKPTLITLNIMDIPGVPGRIGMCACPGIRRSATAAPNSPQQDLRRDLEYIAQQKPRWLVTLMEERELVMLELDTLPSEARRLGIDWKHLPITDMGAPTAVFEQRWRDARSDLHSALINGELIVLHCWAGLGRTGTIAAKLLVEFGIAPKVAIDHVRAARHGAIQSRQQERYLRKLKPPPTP